VKVPLLRFVTGEHSDELSDCGLLQMALRARYEESSVFFDGSLTPQNLSELLGEFVLLDFNEDFGMSPILPGSQLQKAISAVVELPSIPRQWYWVQYVKPDYQGRNAFLRLWNAERQLPNRAPDYHDFLAATIDFDSRGMFKTVEFGTMPNEARGGKQEPAPFSHIGHDPASVLHPSILSSYSLVGVSARQDAHLSALDRSLCLVSGEIGAGTPQRCIPAELYLFMETEMREWAQIFGRWYKIWSSRELSWAWNRPVNAAQFLARLSDKESDEIIERLLSRFPSGQKPVVALASFLPEITRQHQEMCPNPAIQAIKRLLYFAARLRADGHPMSVIELVTGSAMQGILFQKDEREKTRKYFVKRQPREQIMERLLDNLELAVESAPLGSESVLLALELEPGPCFLVNNWQSLQKLSERLKRRGNLSRRVGFNLDVGHWRIAKITPNQVNESEDIKNRLIHAHLSAHHRCAHFGDAPLASDQMTPDGNGDDELIPWFHLLRSIYEGNGNPDAESLPFSGHISIELEATRDCELVRESYLKLVSLLEKVNSLKDFQHA
jgi:sugar phosphate isomerase/epimerase